MIRRVLVLGGTLGGIAYAYVTYSPTITAKATRINAGRPVLIDPEQYYKFKLIEKEDLTHDTRRLRFELPNPTDILGILPGQHVITLSNVIKNGKLYHRPYSPTSRVDQQGWFDLVVKVYAESPKYPGGGQMSRFLDTTKLGEHVEMKGPVGRLKYLGNGRFSLIHVKKGPEELKTYKNIGMVAGGSGIAPLYHVALAIANEKENKATNVKMIFANHTENDIIMRKDLDEMAKDKSNRFKIWYTVTRALDPKHWKYDVGHVSEEMFKKHLPPPSDDTLILVCGPKGFVKESSHSMLIKIGHKPENIFLY